MPQIKFISANGTSQEVDVEAGITIMQAAVDNGIDDILAECGGACSCATCHCYVNEEWADKVTEASDIEKDMLDCVLNQQDNSRLSCQITVTQELDGITVTLPESQY